VLITASVFPPAAAAAMPITLGVGVTGLGVNTLGKAIDSDGLKEFGKDLAGIALNAKDIQEP